MLGCCCHYGGCVAFCGLLLVHLQRVYAMTACGGVKLGRDLSASGD